MEALTVGLQNLRLADFFLDNREPQQDDIERLRRGKSFLHNTRANYAYLSGGSSEGLEELNVELTEHTCLTLARIQKLGRDNKRIQDALKHLEQRLEEVIQGSALGKQERDQLGKFFEAIGEAMVSEEVNRSEIEEDESAELREA
ncbi:MAG: hypothetical protein AMXMBFR36_09160 [Acidobacteriota bacterium]